MRLNLLIPIGLLVASAVVSATAADTISSKDRQFVTKAVQAGKAEVAAGQLAVSRSTNADVKSFGQRMVDDHTKAGAELEQIAKSKGLTVPQAPNSSQQKLAQKLEKAQGADFDKLYARQAGVEGHKDAVKLFTDESKHGSDPDLKAFAAKTLPTIQDHYKMAQQLAASVKK